jgi:hypothetical protein
MPLVMLQWQYLLNFNLKFITFNKEPQGLCLYLRAEQHLTGILTGI